MLYAVCYSSRIARSNGYAAFLFLFMSIFMYTVGYIFELASSTPETIYLSLKIEYLGAPLIAVFWFLFAVYYNNYSIKSKAVMALLFVVPLTTIVMLYTNEYHHFHYRTFDVDASGLFPVAVTQKGWWYYVDFVYKMLVAFAGLALFAFSYGKATGYRRRQAKTIFIGALSLWIGNFLQMLGFAPYGIDIEPFILSAALPLSGFAMSRLRMFDLVPIARDKVFKTMSASVLVLDGKLRVVDFNDSAVSILPALSEDAVGLTVMDVFPEQSSLDVAALVQNEEMEIALPVAGGLRFYKVSCARVGESEKDSGLIVSLYDMTESKELLEKMHLMRHKSTRIEKLNASMDQYHTTAVYLKDHMMVLVNVFAITLFQRFALFTATWFVYKAFGLSGTNAFVIILLQSVISVSVDMLPLPGGMGISEKLFSMIFEPVFGSTLLIPGMILSRGLGYYTELLISAIFTIVANFTIGRNLRKKA